jgi:hypothetical protein
MFLSGCSGMTVETPTETPPEFLKTESPTPTPVARVEEIRGEVVYPGGFSSAEIKVSVKATVERTGLTVLLTDSEGTTIADSYISERDLLDGRDSTSLPVSTSVVSGTYYVQIVRGTEWGERPQLVSEQEITIPEQKVALRNAEVEAEELQYSDGYTMTYAGVTVDNTGEPPVEITAVDFSVSGQDSALSGFSTTVLESGETKRYETNSSLGLPQLKSGKNRVRFIVRSGGSVLTETTVTKRLQ